GRSLATRVTVVTAAACVGAVAAALTVWYAAKSPILYRPTGTGLVRGLFVAAYVAAGAYTWWRRPASRLGPLLAAIGLVYALTTLNASGDGVVFTLGMVAWACWVASLAYLALCFPRARPGSRAERAFARAVWLATGALWTLILLFGEKLPKGGELVE